jgi:hypothetical protein
MGLLMKRLTCIGSLRDQALYIFSSVLYVVQMHRISLVNEYYSLLGCDFLQFVSSVQMFQGKLLLVSLKSLCHLCCMGVKHGLLHDGGT